MTELSYDAAAEREEIAARIARFRATQEKFAREREEFFAATLDNARRLPDARQAYQRPTLWS